MKQDRKENRQDVYSRITQRIRAISMLRCTNDFACHCFTAPLRCGRNNPLRKPTEPDMNSATPKSCRSNLKASFAAAALLLLVGTSSAVYVHKDTLLAQASAHGLTSAAELLILAGADVNAGFSAAVQAAAANGHVETLALLRDAGADLQPELRGFDNELQTNAPPVW